MRKSISLVAWKDLKRSLDVTHSVTKSAAHFSVRREVLSRCLKRDHGEKWAELKRSWRRQKWARRTRRHAHKVNGRRLAIEVREDPTKWDRLTAKQQGWVREYVERWGQP